MELINSHKDLNVYKNAFHAAMQIFELSKNFPKAEQYSLTDQIRRSSRSVCANSAEAFRKRRYQKSFIAKLSDAESEAAETQVWLEFSLVHNYIGNEEYEELNRNYDYILAQLVTMINQSEKWTYS